MGGQGVTKTMATYSMRNWEASCLFWVTLFYLCPIPHFQLAWLPLSILCEPRWPESCHLELDTLGIMGITGKLWQKITARSLSCCLILVSRGATMWVLWVPQDSRVNGLVSCWCSWEMVDTWRRWSVAGLIGHVGTSLWSVREKLWSFLASLLWREQLSSHS